MSGANRMTDIDGVIAGEDGRLELDPSCDVDVLGANLYAAPKPFGILIFNGKAHIELTTAELEELVRVAVRAGILNLHGGRS